MANLQATKVTSSLDVQQNTYIKLGNVYVSSGTGGSYAHFGLSTWYTGGASWNGAGPAIQLTGNTLNFLKDPSASAVTPFSTSESATTINSTSTTISVASGNSTTNALFGVGAAAGTTAADGKVLVNAGGTSKPFLEVTNCGGNGSNSTSTFSVFKGYLAVKVGANVGPATSVPAGTHYLRLWNNA